MTSRPDRRTLGFSKAVIEVFEFLVPDYGFSRVQTEDTFVRYETSQVFVNVYHGRKSYELNVEVGLLSSDENDSGQFSMYEIESYYRGDDGRAALFHGSDIESVRRTVFRLAKLLLKYGDKLLHGDLESFAELRKYQERKSDEYMLEMEMRQVREDAIDAWRDKRFKELIEIYKRVEEHLAPSELKKLEYAKKKVEGKR